MLMIPDEAFFINSLDEQEIEMRICKFTGHTTVRTSGPISLQFILDDETIPLLNGLLSKFCRTKLYVSEAKTYQSIKEVFADKDGAWGSVILC